MNNKMLPSFNLKKKRPDKSKQVVIVLLFLLFFSGAILAPIQPVKAGIPVMDIPKLAWDKITDLAKKLWQKGGSLAFQQTLRTALNKIAYDTATWVGSGGEGQKPLFVTQDWGDYMAQIGDEAAGDFLENFASNLSQSNSPAQCDRNYEACLSRCRSNDNECENKCEEKRKTCNSKVGTESFTFNVCQPSSLDAQVRIGLGLANEFRPTAPSCTASQMIRNWSDAYQKYTDFQDPQFLTKFADIFDPTSTDLGIYWHGVNLISEKKQEAVENARTKLIGAGGWLDVKDKAGNILTLPNQAELQVENAYEQYAENFGKYTGDAFVDASRLFLNQLALSAFNNFMQNIGKKTSGGLPTSNFLIAFKLTPVT